MKPAKSTKPTRAGKSVQGTKGKVAVAATLAERRLIREQVMAAAARVVAPVERRAGTIEDLRAMDDVQRRKVIDFVASGVPMSCIRRELEEDYGFVLESDEVMTRFYQEEARKRWKYTLETASADADAMINVLRHSGLDFSEALLKALGQQAFRMITQRELDYKQVEKFTRLLLQARGQDNSRLRVKETLGLQRERMERQFQSKLNKALDALAAEIKSHPEVKPYFALFRSKLREAMEGKNKKGERPQISQINADGGGASVTLDPATLTRG